MHTDNLPAHIDGLNQTELADSPARVDGLIQTELADSPARIDGLIQTDDSPAWIDGLIQTDRGEKRAEEELRIGMTLSIGEHVPLG